MSEWPHRYHILVPVAAKDIANQFAMLVGPGGILENSTFGDIKLSSNGQLPESHYACSLLATEAMKNSMLNILTTNPEISFIWHRIDAITGIIQSSSRESQTVLNAINNQQVWTWTDTLADLNLIVIPPESE